MTTKASRAVPSQLGRIKLKYVALLLVGLLAWSSFYAPEAIGLLLTLNLIFLFLLNIARFRFLPKAPTSSGLSLVQAPPNDPPKIRAVLVCNEGEGKKTLRTLRGLLEQNYSHLEVVTLKLGPYDESYVDLKEFCAKDSKRFVLFRREGPLTHGEAISACLEHGAQEYKSALLLTPGLKLDPHVLSQAVSSIETKQADYLQFFSYTLRPTINDIKRLRFYHTYMRAAPSCASPCLIAPMTLIRKTAIPSRGVWKSEPNPFLALSISLIKNGKRGFFEPRPCGSGANSTALDLKQTIYDIKLGDALQIGAPRLIPLLLQLTSHFHFLTAPILYFALKITDQFTVVDLLPRDEHGAFLAGSAVLVSLYFKLALIYQKHCEKMPMKSILKNYFIDIGSNFHGRGNISRLFNVVSLLAFITMGGALYHANQSPAFLTPIFAGLLAMVGLGMVLLDNNHLPRPRPTRRPKVKSRKDKSVWRVEMNSSEA